jgi:hypothetical protein
MPACARPSRMRSMKGSGTPSEEDRCCRPSASKRLLIHESRERAVADPAPSPLHRHEGVGLERRYQRPAGVSTHGGTKAGGGRREAGGKSGFSLETSLPPAPLPVRGTRGFLPAFVRGPAPCGWPSQRDSGLRPRPLKSRIRWGRPGFGEQARDPADIVCQSQRRSRDAWSASGASLGLAISSSLLA